MLDIIGTAEERSTGLNPTDTAITLLTAKANSGKLFQMSREGSLVPVKTSFIDSEILSALVVADTPGSGDPKIVNEMIQDFIPICDHVLYFISATNPIDQADVPLLIEKHRSLPFIPISFVITRSDEFLFNKGQGFEGDNIDKSKKDSFIGKLISRLKIFTDAGEITDADFIFIDNPSKYNIDILRDRLMQWSQTLDNSTLIKNHGHKVNYYDSKLAQIELYFLSIIKNKLQISEEFLKTAKGNVSKFDAAVELNNEKLKMVWLEAVQNLTRSLQSEQDASDALKIQYPMRSVSSSEEFLTAVKLIDETIENHSNGHLGKLVADVYQTYKDILIIFKQDIREILRSTDVFDLEVIPLPQKIDFSSADSTSQVDFSKLNDQLHRFFQAISAVLEGEKMKVLAKLGSVENNIRLQRLCNTVDDVYKTGSETIVVNFEKFFGVIEMYKGSVMAKNTKQTIEKLRIGKQLDDLDDDFSDEFRLYNTDEAITAIYPKKEMDEIQLKTDLNSIEGEIHLLKRAIQTMPTNLEHDEHSFGKEDLKLSDIMGSVMSAIDDKVNALYRDKLSAINENHRAAYLKFKEIKGEQVRVRKRKLMLWGAVLAVVSFAGYLMMLKLNFITPQSMYMTIFISLGTAALSYVLGNLIARARYDLSKMLVRHTRKFNEASKNRFSNALNEDFFNLLISSVSESRPKDLPSLKQIFMGRMDVITGPGKNNADSSLQILSSHNASLNKLIDKYDKLNSDFQQKFMRLFHDPDANLEKIASITQSIKEKSIKPSFDLLASTQSELDRVCSEIELATTTNLNQNLVAETL